MGLTGAAATEKMTIRKKKPFFFASFKKLLCRLFFDFTKWISTAAEITNLGVLAETILSYSLKSEII